MGKPKEYMLNIHDILQIPEKSFDNFLIDLKKWHGAARNTVNLLETIAKATNQPIPKELVTMRWIDDGKHDGKVDPKYKAGQMDSMFVIFRGQS